MVHCTLTISGSSLESKQFLALHSDVPGPGNQAEFFDKPFQNMSRLCVVDFKDEAKTGVGTIDSC